MTLLAGTIRALARSAITQKLKPGTIGDMCVESYQQLYDFNNCLYVLGVHAEYGNPMNTDYAVFVYSYEFLNGLTVDTTDTLTVPATIDVAGDSVTNMKALLRDLANNKCKKYTLGFDDNNWYTQFLEQDFSNDNMYKLKIDFLQPHLIPPRVTTKYLYGCYSNVNVLIIPLREIPKSITTAGLMPAEIIAAANEVVNKNLLINNIRQASYQS